MRFIGWGDKNFSYEALRFFVAFAPFINEHKYCFIYCITFTKEGKTWISQTLCSNCWALPRWSNHTECYCSDNCGIKISFYFKIFVLNMFLLKILFDLVLICVNIYLLHQSEFKKIEETHWILKLFEKL